MMVFVELLPHVRIHRRLREMHGFRPLTDSERNDGALQLDISAEALAGPYECLPILENPWR